MPRIGAVATAFTRGGDSLHYTDCILIIEDDANIRRAVSQALSETARTIIEASSAREGLERASSDNPNLVVLDLGLPDREGIEVCRRLRTQSTSPIVVLSARHSDDEKVSLLNAGADDYVTKPFSIPEFVARITAHLRRVNLYAGANAESIIHAGELVIDVGRRTVMRGDRVIKLTPVEWSILRVLVTQAGRTLTHRQIFHGAWGRAFGNPQQHLRVHVTNLRRKVERDPTSPELILTEPGVGYRCEIT
jgi:two-component system KDP operon response regulator KdpE